MYYEDDDFTDAWVRAETVILHHGNAKNACFRSRATWRAFEGTHMPTSNTIFGVIWRTCGHARIDPGDDLIDLCVRQKGPLQWHLPKTTDAPHQGPY
jgi:hypothetical protein